MDKRTISKRVKSVGEAPCLGCQDREIGCHGRCETYGTWKKAIEARRKKRGEEVIRDKAADAYLIEANFKAREIARRKKKR